MANSTTLYRPLQWSHGLLTMEIPALGRADAETRGASMEPWPVDHGDGTMPPADKPSSWMLQWSHGLLTMEMTAALVMMAVYYSLLQWSHGLLTMEMPGSDPRGDAAVRLQWSHGLLTMEICPRGPRDHRHRAASMEPWPVDHGDLDRSLRVVRRRRASMEPWPVDHGDGRSASGVAAPSGLQWSHGLLTMEICPRRRWPCTASSLQWSHGLLTMEIVSE